MRKMTETCAIALKGLGKQYRVYAQPKDRLKQMLFGAFKTFYSPFNALKGIDLQVTRGETVGLIGRNGSGKSTLLQLICGTLTPTSGQVEVHGKIAALLELGAGFNPEFSGRENIFLNAAILGLSKAETLEKYDAIVGFSGLEVAQIEQPVKTYSSGMYVRLAFSVAIAVEPDILVIDEALAVGDEGFQRKCFARIKELKEQGTTILFVSHSAQSIIELCDRAVLLDSGEKLCEGIPKDIISGYHRLIYAARDARPAIRAELKAGKLSAVSATAEGEIENGAVINHDRIEYGPDGGRILDYYLTDLEDARTQTLETGGRYRLHYSIEAQSDLTKPKFGMLIKNKRGVQLGGGIAESLYLQGKTLASGEQRHICFEFDCPLRPGHYFLNCGFTRQDNDEEIFVHRILDALEFKVIESTPTKDITPAGQIDLKLTVSGCE